MAQYIQGIYDPYTGELVSDGWTIQERDGSVSYYDTDWTPFPEAMADAVPPEMAMEEALPLPSPASGPATGPGPQTGTDYGNPYDPTGQVRVNAYDPSLPGASGGGQYVPIQPANYAVAQRDPASGRPMYGNGIQHPSWSGQPLVPGGQWNTGQPSNQRQMYVPGGAAAGPYSTRAAPLVTTPTKGGSAVDADVYRTGNPGGGGGGGGRALYDAWRSKLTAKLYPGSGSGYSSPSGGSYSGSYGVGAPTSGAGEPRMRGDWARNVDPGQAYGIAYRPSMMLPRVAPSLDNTSPLYQMLADAPAAQLGSILNADKRVKPQDALSSQINGVGNFYDAAANGLQWPTFEELSTGLTHAKKRSALGQSLHNQPVSLATQTYSSLLNAALDSSLPAQTAAAYSEQADALMDEYGAKFMRRPPNRTPPINRWVGRRLF